MNLDDMMCENEEYKKKHKPAKRIGKALGDKKPESVKLEDKK